MYYYHHYHCAGKAFLLAAAAAAALCNRRLGNLWWRPPSSPPEMGFGIFVLFSGFRGIFYVCVVHVSTYLLGLRDSDSNAYSDSDSHSHSLRGKRRRSGAMCVCCLALIGSMESNWRLARLAALCSLSLQIWVMWLIGKDWRIVVLQVRPRFSCCLHAHNEEITRSWKKTGTT